MKTLPWLVASAAAATAAYLLLNLPSAQHSTGSDTLEGAARKTADWGSKQRVSGTAAHFLGQAKENLGRATGNADLTDRGSMDEIAGAAKNAAGQLAQAAGQTLHDLNR